MFGRHRKALADNRVAELQATNERLERTIMGLRRERKLALCPVSGIRQRAYQEGLTEGMRRGHVHCIGKSSAPHQHDFAALEARVLALEIAGQLPVDWLRGTRTRGVWSGNGPSLQNLPRRAKHEPEYRYFRSAAGNFRWRFRVGSHMDTLVMVSAGPVAKWEPSVKTVRQVLNDSRFIHLGSEPKWR